MADTEPDGLDETAERLLQLTVTAAAQAAERVAQARAHAAPDAQALRSQQARDYADRAHAECRAAQTQLTLTRGSRRSNPAGRPQTVDGKQPTVLRDPANAEQRAAATEAAVLMAADAHSDTGRRVDNWLTDHGRDLSADLAPDDVVAAVDARLRAELFHSETAVLATAARAQPVPSPTAPLAPHLTNAQHRQPR